LTLAGTRLKVVEHARRPPAVLATLASADKAKWNNGTQTIGRAFHEGETVHLNAGQARVSLGCGAELLATGPCRFTFVAFDRVRLEEGSILVDVAEWAKGFTVVTDKMEVIDLGTIFEVATSPGSEAETTVLKGMVRALPTVRLGSEQRSVLLTEGEGLAVDQAGNQRSFQHDSASALRKLELDGLAMYRPVDLHNTGLGLAEGDQDAHWRVIAGPNGKHTQPEFATVCGPHYRYLENDPAVSQWVSVGDWRNATPNSIYTFATSFDLDGYDLSTMHLFGRFLADNGIEEVRVNGKSVKVESWVDNVYGQRFDGSNFRFVNITEGLVNGQNVIELDVFNGTQVDPATNKAVVQPNCMALRVEWYAFGRREQIETAMGAKAE
jgi:hypothetical protein